MSLSDLWKHVDNLNKKYFPDNKLKPIVGNGRIKNPKFMFVFINPTIRNISSDPSWPGFRAPWIGTKHVWRIFHRAGLFDDELMNKINKSSDWSVEFATRVYKHLAKRGFYFTNIVKWTGEDAALPNSEKIKLFLPILEKEIKLVNPDYIVTFGLIPFEYLTKQKIKLGEYHKNSTKNKKLKKYNYKIGSKIHKVIPCYFPVGRGDPKKAVDILKLLP